MADYALIFVRHVCEVGRVDEPVRKCREVERCLRECKFAWSLNFYDREVPARCVNLPRHRAGVLRKNVLMCAGWFCRKGPFVSDTFRASAQYCVL